MQATLHLVVSNVAPGQERKHDRQHLACRTLAQQRQQSLRHITDVWLTAAGDTAAIECSGVKAKMLLAYSRQNCSRRINAAASHFCAGWANACKRDESGGGGGEGGTRKQSG